MPLNTERTASICRCHFHVTLNTDSIQTEHIHTNISDTNTLKQKPKPKPKNFLSFTNPQTKQKPKPTDLPTVTPKPTFFRTSQNPQTQASLKHKQWKGGALKTEKGKEIERERERRTTTTSDVGTAEIAGCMWWPIGNSVASLGLGQDLNQESLDRDWEILRRRRGWKELSWVDLTHLGINLVLPARLHGHGIFGVVSVSDTGTGTTRRIPVSGECPLF